MGRRFLEEPVGSLLIEAVQRDRAGDAEVIGARRSYVDRGPLPADRREEVGGAALLREDKRGDLLRLPLLAEDAPVDREPEVVLAVRKPAPTFD